MYYYKTKTVYSIPVYPLNTIYFCFNRHTAKQHALIFKKAYETYTRPVKLRFKKDTFEQEFAVMVLDLQEKGYEVKLIPDHYRFTPYILLNVKKNGVFSSKTAVLNHVITKAQINVKTVKAFTDYRYIDRKGKERIITKTDNAVILNNNIKIEFIEIPYHDWITFKISAPHQYLNRLYS